MIEYQIVEEKHRTYSRFTPQWRVKKSWFSRLFAYYRGWLDFHREQIYKMEIVKVFDTYEEAAEVIEQDKKSREEHNNWKMKSEIAEIFEYEKIKHKIS